MARQRKVNAGRLSRLDLRGESANDNSDRAEPIPIYRSRKLRFRTYVFLGEGSIITARDPTKSFADRERALRDARAFLSMALDLRHALDREDRFRIYHLVSLADRTLGEMKRERSGTLAPVVSFAAWAASHGDHEQARA